MIALLVVSGLLASAMADCSIAYLSNMDLEDFLDSAVKSEPALAYTYNIGFTEQSEDLRVLELSAAESREELPNVKFIAGVHGDEAIGTEILIKFIEYLIDAYKREERFVTWLLNNTRIHFLPRLNKDGYEYAIEGVCYLGPGRNNMAGYDLNRVFSPTADYASEAAAVMSWLKHDDAFVLSATLNAGEMVAVYPPDNKGDFGGLNSSMDDDVFKHLASVYARNHKTMSTRNGCTGSTFENGTINGAAWYPVNGSMSDFNYKSGIMELTLEISCCKFPPSNEICSIWDENKMALLKLAAEANRGVRGRVTAYGNPIPEATVSILGRNMTVKTNNKGYYFRILLPGRYFIKVEAEGMKVFIDDFVVPQSDTAFLKWTVFNIELENDTTTQDTPHEQQTISYDEGGLDPYTTTYATSTNDDSYLSSPDDNDPKVGLVTGAASKNNQNSLYSIFIVIFCKYLLNCIVNGLDNKKCILFL